MSDEKETFTSRVYLHFKSVWRGTYEQRKRRLRKNDVSSEPFGKNRDPKPLSETLASVTSDFGWTSMLAESAIAHNWPDLVGNTLAEHAKVLEVSAGVIRVQCDSTAWATELRRLRAHVLTRIHEEFSEAQIEEIKFIAPNAPSWKHGPKSIPGRGPRDTYG